MAKAGPDIVEHLFAFWKTPGPVMGRHSIERIEIGRYVARTARIAIVIPDPAEVGPAFEDNHVRCAVLGQRMSDWET